MGIAGLQLVNSSSPSSSYHRHHYHRGGNILSHARARLSISVFPSVSPVEISHIGVDGSPVADKVGGIGMIGTEYSLPDEQGLSSHFIRVADQILQRLQGGNLVGVVVSQLVCASGVKRRDIHEGGRGKKG